MKPGSIIKHKKFLDVCCEVVEVHDMGSTLNLYVEWINQGLARSWYMPANRQVIKIDKEKLSEWFITEPGQPCYRHANWRIVNGI